MHMCIYNIYKLKRLDIMDKKKSIVLITAGLLALGTIDSNYE